MGIMHPGLRVARLAAGCACLALATVGALAAPPGYERDTRAYNLAHGRVVFSEHCMACHAEGQGGAPIAGEPGDWSGRIDQPLSDLIAHAIEGHGDMPARGETELVDQEIAAAVAYVVSRARMVLEGRVATLPESDSEVGESLDGEQLDDAVVRMFLLLMGKERWR